MYNVSNNSEEEDKRWGVITDQRVIDAWEKKEQNPGAIDMRTAPLRTLPAVFYPKRRFINIQVNNEGRAVAINCEANLKFLKNSNRCGPLSFKEKSLVWEDGKQKTDIGVGNKRVFHLAFSQQRLTYDQKWNMGTIYCEIEKQKVTPKGWVCTKRALENQVYSLEEGMCTGEFKVHVCVIDENGNRDSKHFIITIPNEWHWPVISAKMLECDCPKT